MKTLFTLCLAVLGSISFAAGNVELTSAEKKLLEMTPAEYREAVIPPEVPRAFRVHNDGCPVCGNAIWKHGRYPWIFDLKKPFKLQCPECKNTFPDNDYAEFLKTGDRAKLTGKFVDDGRGYKKPGENKGKYWFVAYYHHWSFNSYNMIAPLQRAYERTGNPEFARRLLARLDRYAEYYSRYDYNKQSRYAEEVQPTYNGRILNAIWETGVSRKFAVAYRATKPFLQQGDAELEKITGKTCKEIMQNIENNMLRVMANDIMTENGHNWGNFGMHQMALLEIASILQDPAMVRWVTDFRKSVRWFSTPLDYAIYCNFFGDGSPSESPQYNRYWLNDLNQIFAALLKCGVDEKKRHPFAERIFRYEDKLRVCGKFTPSSGDSGSIRGNEPPLPPEEKRKDPLWGRKSSLLPAYGVLTMQNARPGKETAVWFSFGAYYGHKHRDAMHMEIFAGNVPMMPDFGYPDSASGDDPERFAFHLNTVTHNTVMVDAKMQQFFQPAALLHCDLGRTVQRVEADVPWLYRHVSLYKRTILTCEPAPGKLVVLDLFRIRGGSRHDWMIHSATEKAVSSAPETPVKGTLAGENVPYGDFYDAPELRGRGKKYHSYRGSGFQYLTNVRKLETMEKSSVTFPAEAGKGFEPVKGAYLKVYPLNGADETRFLADGKPPRTQKNTQKHVTFFNRRRTGKAPLQSIFATVYETGSADLPAVTSLQVRSCTFDKVEVE
ncbi:MAG: heparinase II/III family protein, partial [Lentisphaeria bacterium]|nr:heparinase II/III family protein [Lentisphaeria bacterium]